MSFAQYSDEAKVDSLIRELIVLEKGEQKVEILLEISQEYLKYDAVKSEEYAKRAYNMSADIDYEMGTLRSAKKLSHVEVYYNLNYYIGLDYLATALKIAEKRRDQNELMEIYQHFGFVKGLMQNYDEAIEYYNKAVRIAQTLGEHESLASLYSYLADVYIEKGDEKNAKDYYARVYRMIENGKIDGTTSVNMLSQAMYFRMSEDYDAAIDIYRKAVTKFHNENNARFESYAYSQLAATLMLKGKYYEALAEANEGLAIANALNLNKERMDNYQVQIAIFDSLGDYKKTYTTLIKYTRFKDSLTSALVAEQNQKYQSNYEKVVNENKIAQLNEEKKNHELEVENQRLNRNIIIGLLVFAVLLVMLMILRLRYINKKEKELRVLSLATNHSTNSIVIFDNEIKVEWVNKGFETLTGLKLDQVKGEYFLDFYNGPALSIQVREELENNFNSGETFQMELTSFHRSTDDAYWISINVTPLFNEDGSIRSYVSVATDITEIHEAQVAIQKAHDRTILLNEIGRQITSSLSVIDIIEKVYENVNKLMDAQNMGIGIYKETEDHLFFPEPIENGNKLNSFAYPLEDEKRIAIKCFQNNEEIVVGTIEERLAVTGEDAAPLAGEQPNSIIYIPLISKWKTIGVFSVQSMAENAYGERELNIVRTLANFIAIALDNAGLYENMEERVAERTKEVTAQKEMLQMNYENTKLLSELGVEISSSLEMDEIFESLYDSVTKLMDAEIFGIRLLDEENNRIVYKYEIESGKRDPEMAVSLDDKDNYSVWCIENDKEILINDNQKEFSKYVEEIKVPSGEMPSSLIFFPLHGEGKVLGLLTVQSFKKNAYSQYHLELVKTLAAYAAAAYNNASLYDTLELKVEERTNELNQKNKDIMASINYAKRIQNGILPSASFMEQLLENSFVFYRPRDVVSGDFYWVERGAGKIFFAVVDCTGHGVPGALMSIIGKNILDQAVNEKRLDDPSMILAFLRAGLRFAFGAEEQDSSEIEDGMDLGICVYDVEDKVLDFAGANINLHQVRNRELEVFKGDKSGVSASDFTMKHFTCHSINVLKDDQYYLSSDGFPDQFGGERTKKYSQRRFQELILKVSDTEFSQQHDEIQAEFERWKGDNGQLDDVCVMGVKL